jgi:lysophospholipase L1-like esterase
MPRRRKIDKERKRRILFHHMNRFKYLARRASFTLLFGLVTVAVPLSAQSTTQPFPSSLSPAPARLLLHEGDRVLFYGDSITAQRLYTRFLEDIVVSRYPDLHVEFFNAGVSGDTVNGGSAGEAALRLRRDVFPHRPTVVTVMLGMNDGHYRTGNEADRTAFHAGYAALLDALHTNLSSASIFPIRPSPYDEIAHAPSVIGYNSVLIGFGDDVALLGQQRGLHTCDLNGAMQHALQQGIVLEPQLAGILLPDRIHPSQAGHWILALSLAQCFGVDPIVSSVSLDAADVKTLGAYKAAVTDLRKTSHGIEWTQLDAALPLPLELNNPETDFLLKVSQLVEWDRQMLQVRRLPAARYNLMIDGEKISTLDSAALETGVNLALLETPMQKQSRAIDSKADSRAKISATRFNLLTASPAIQDLSGALSAIDELDRRMLNDERQQAQPKPHHISLMRE